MDKKLPLLPAAIHQMRMMQLQHPNSPLSSRNNNNLDLEYKKSSILSHRQQNMESLISQKRFLSPMNNRKEKDEYDELINNYPRNKNQSKYAISSQIRQMARLEASNSDIRDQMQLLPVLNTKSSKQLVVQKKETLHLTPWNAPPALIDGNLFNQSPKLIQNLKQNLETPDNSQLQPKYFKQRHSVVESQPENLISELDSIHQNIRFETYNKILNKSPLFKVSHQKIQKLQQQKSKKTIYFSPESYESFEVINDKIETRSYESNSKQKAQSFELDSTTETSNKQNKLKIEILQQKALSIEGGSTQKINDMGMEHIISNEKLVHVSTPISNKRSRSKIKKLKQSNKERYLHQTSNNGGKQIIEQLQNEKMINYQKNQSMMLDISPQKITLHQPLHLPLKTKKKEKQQKLLEQVTNIYSQPTQLISKRYPSSKKQQSHWEKVENFQKKIYNVKIKIMDQKKQLAQLTKSMDSDGTEHSEDRVEKQRKISEQNRVKYIYDESPKSPSKKPKKVKIQSSPSPNLEFEIKNNLASPRILLIDGPVLNKSPTRLNRELMSPAKKHNLMDNRDLIGIDFEYSAED